MSNDFPSSNPRVRINSIDVLADNWYTLRKIDFDIQDSNGEWTTQQREAYDRGNGATILLINWQQRTVLLTRQFRIPAYLNSHPDGMLVEAAAGLLDDDDPETAIRREAEEELGYRVGPVTFLFDLFMSPGSVTEKVAYFVAEYEPKHQVSEGGGVDEEGEDIEVLEIDLDRALDMIETGEIIDGKTVLLLQWAALNDPARAS